MDNTSSDHKGDDISVEAIAESNPHYILVLDRDQAKSDSKTSTPAKDVINNSPALQNLDVVKNNRIYYAPDDTYTNESIQTFTKIFEGLKDLFQSEK
ncbi:ABC transporter substrate-binding protein [uncultured Anaerococcus sp.]|uniref:ABC transporter substrate-binding protein n=1 Tax=uncultured Anaerococcus sp. TaxID=293428 RepID=UPI00262EDE65|nr:ABC transporter substrate-binding protein [uncultured Anaerococcus sp.]